MRPTRPQRGGHLGAENEAPVGKSLPRTRCGAAHSPGNRAAFGGAGGGPVQRDRPGPGPARRRDNPRQLGQGLRGAQEEGRVRRPPRLRPRDRRAVLRRPRRRHRRLDKRHVPGHRGARRRGATAGNTRGSTPSSTSSPASTPTAPTCWSCWPSPRTAGGPTSTPSSPSTSRGRSGTRFSQCPQPGEMGQSLRRLGDRGSPRDPLRRR